MVREKREKPRGMIHRRAANRRIDHARFLPPPELAEQVEHFWRVCWDLDQPYSVALLPHPSVALTLEVDGPWVTGVQTGRYERVLSGAGLVFGVKFRPGTFRGPCGRPVADLTDRVVPAAEIWPGIPRALPCPGCDDRANAAAITDWLAPRLPPLDSGALRARALVAAVAADRTLLRVERLATRAGVSPRTVQRIFREHVGVGPKWVIQRYRLHEALAAIEEGGEVDWAAFALSLGYFDQAHFIGEFRRLVGVTPGDYRASTLSE